MNIERAKQIYDSPDNIDVQLDNGMPVWIEKVDMENGVATVQVGMKPTDVQTVDVGRLKETQ